MLQKGDIITFDTEYNRDRGLVFQRVERIGPKAVDLVSHFGPRGWGTAAARKNREDLRGATIVDAAVMEDYTRRVAECWEAVMALMPDDPTGRWALMGRMRKGICNHVFGQPKISW